MKIIFIVLVSIICFNSNTHAQGKKSITLEDIWTNNTFQLKRFEGFRWLNHPRQYSKLIYDTLTYSYQINILDIETNKTIKTIAHSNQLIPTSDSLPLDIDEYTLSPDEQKILFKTQTEGIYRHSDKAIFYHYEIKTKKLQLLASGKKISNVEFSPDSKKIAFCANNNLYINDLVNFDEDIKITYSGKENEIINGSSDWVYEEEFELVKAYFWSPDSKKIAYYTFDESQVKEYSMQMWNNLYPQNFTFKYPKAGEKNSEISISVYNYTTSITEKLFDGKNQNIYIPRINWTSDPEVLSIRWLNRNQDSLKIFHVNLNSKLCTLIKTFADKYYVEVDDNFFYLPNNQGFVCTSEHDGFRHIYTYNMDGSLRKQLTKGRWEVSEIIKIDNKTKQIYYTSLEISSIDKNFYVIDFEGNNKRKLTTGKGINVPSIDNFGNYFVNSSTSANGLIITLHQLKTGKKIKVLEDNKAYKNKIAEYEIGSIEQKIFVNATKDSLNYWIIKPANFDSTKKYPVFMGVYGGPGSQEVLRLWNKSNFLWYQMLAQKGYIIACVDNRGTGGKGAYFKKCTTRQLGKLETEDQIEFAKYLTTKSYVDKNRIGIWGWSYGGYMSTLCLLLGNDIFKLGIAVAPVTNWRFYDSIYTERFLKTPQDNTAGYEDYSPINHVAKLKGKYLLIHGTGDDNVHFQNAVQMQDALIKAGKQFDSFYYPDKDHSIGGSKTRLHLYKMMTDFLDRNL